MDRNFSAGTKVPLSKPSLSARRAWIEIRNIWYRSHDGNVALRKESVDRNTDTISDYLRANRSLSARRAWIEIEDDGILSTGAPSRSPQGERG